MGREGQGVCLFKCTLCQCDKEFDGFIRNTKALFSRVRLTPLSSTQSADKLQKRKKPTTHQHPAQQGRKGEADGRAETPSWRFRDLALQGAGWRVGTVGTAGVFSKNTDTQAILPFPRRPL